jgi:hypothetical protein
MPSRHSSHPKVAEGDSDWPPSASGSVSKGSEPAEGRWSAERQGLPMQHRLAQYYLNIYRLRLVMAKNGTTWPSVAGLEFYKRFVTAL